MTRRHPSLLDPKFKYVPSVATNITDTWRKFGWLPKCELPGPRTVVALMPRERKGKA